MTNQQGKNQTAGIAGKILVAWKAGRESDLSEELGRLASQNAEGLNSLEMERMELLEGIVQSLRQAGANHHGHRAAIRLLEHLATG